MDPKNKREAYLASIARAVEDYRKNHRQDPNVLVLSLADVGQIESAYRDLYDQNACLFSGKISSIVFSGAKLHVAVSWGMVQGEVRVGRLDLAEV